MPTLAAPSFLLGAALAAGVVVALHLLAWRRPVPRPLPTARFVPASSARAVSRAVQLRDVALMLVRVAALLLAGLAMARPTFSAARSGVARVLVLDASRRVASAREVADSARAAASGAVASGAATVVRVRVDSAARVLPDSALGDIAPVRGTLGAGMIVATREARRLARTHERVEIVVISPFAAESWDASMEAVRERWEGPVRAVRVAAVNDSAADARATDGVGAPGTLRDPVDAALALAMPSPAVARGGVHLVRDALTSADSIVARNGGVVIAWPRATVPESAFATRALTLGDRTTIGRLAPTTAFAESPDAALDDSAARRAGASSPRPTTTGARSGGGRSLRSGMLPIGNILARWDDGTHAAVESALGAGCIRTVAVALSADGDAALSTSLRAALRELAAPCGGGSVAVVDSARLANWAKPREDTLAGDRTARPAIAPDVEQGRDTQRWLLLAVALLLAAEWWMRRARASAVNAESRPAAAVSEAA
ncbi:MAG: BatA domain-containing protein [Gemmatimonadaceae bacterium]